MENPTQTTPEQLTQFLEDCKGTISDALHFSDTSLSDWFMAYTESNAYANLTAERRKEVFTHYENFREFLRVIDEYTEQIK